MNYNNYYLISSSTGWNYYTTFSAWRAACSCDLESSNTNLNLNTGNQPTGVIFRLDIEWHEPLESPPTPALDIDNFSACPLTVFGKLDNWGLSISIRPVHQALQRPYLRLRTKSLQVRRSQILVPRMPSTF